MVGPKRRLQPERVGDVHVKIGAAIRNLMEVRDIEHGGDDTKYWEASIEDIRVGHYYEGIPRAGQRIEITCWIREEPGLIPVDPTFNSRNQEIIVGILDVDAPISKSDRLAGEIRIMIAYPGNMFGLPVDSWVMQEYQGPAVDEYQLADDYFQWRYDSASVFLQERGIVWMALKKWLGKVWRSIQDEKLELSVDRSPKRIDKVNWNSSFKVSDFADPETLRELRLSQMEIVDMDEYETNQEIANWSKWLWTVVPSNYLDSEGTVTKINGTTVILGEFSSCNLVMAIGGIAPRWLGTRTINWSLPFPLIPSTDPLE